MAYSEAIYTCNAPNSSSAGAPPQTPLGSSQCSPDHLYLDIRGLLLRDGNGKEMRDEGKGREKEVRGAA